jgi:RNA methyltransferase, TrmH family
MQTELVTSAANLTIKRLRSLREKKYRRQEGLFLAEGLRICAEAVEAGWPPRVLVFASAHRDHPLVRRLVHATHAARGRTIETTPDILSGLTAKDNPQAVVGAFEPRDTTLADLDRTRPRYLVAQSLKDPGNLGTMLRTCDATGTTGLILLDESCDPYSVEAVRASMGALFTVPVVCSRWDTFLPWLHSAGPAARLIGAALDARAVAYDAADYAAPAFILMGNEQTGLPDAMRAACDTLVQIPMLGKADSLNVAVSAAVLLYRALAVQSAVQSAALSAA